MSSGPPCPLPPCAAAVYVQWSGHTGGDIRLHCPGQQQRQLRPHVCSRAAQHPAAVSHGRCATELKPCIQLVCTGIVCLQGTTPFCKWEKVYCCDAGRGHHGTCKSSRLWALGACQSSWQTSCHPPAMGAHVSISSSTSSCLVLLAACSTAQGGAARALCAPCTQRLPGCLWLNASRGGPARCTGSLGCDCQLFIDPSPCPRPSEQLWKVTEWLEGPAGSPTLFSLASPPCCPMVGCVMLLASWS